MTMANVAAMGPPPSPREPRRSGRRTLPAASASKSPAGSPTSDTAPRAASHNGSKDHSTRPPLPSSGSSTKKRGKQEDLEVSLDEPPRNGVHGGGGQRAKRKSGSKDKDKNSPVDEHIDDSGLTGTPGDDAGDGAGQEEEEGGITRCICGLDGSEDDADVGDTMVFCEGCKVWQHCQCMGYLTAADIPDQHYCEQCRPEKFTELLKKYAKKARQSSISSHAAAANATRQSRSHSPTHLFKPTKRRNTMNSRDAAYEESFQALLEATAAEAAAAKENIDTTAVAATNGSVNGHAEADPDVEAISNARKKRKRSDEDVHSTKRTRSASTDPPPTPSAAMARDPTPVNGSITKSAPTASAKSSARNKRGGARKALVQDLAVDADDANSVASASNKRQASRAKAGSGQEKRSQGVASANTPSAAAARAYHASHAYAASQQPLFTSWNLPDHFAHLKGVLPAEVPAPLEVRGSGVDAAGRESLERTTERGVKVKWPAKRVSVGDMNKRVRALVEWVGREQASAMERGRRRDALERACRDAGVAAEGEEQVAMIVDGALVMESPAQEKPNVLEEQSRPPPDAASDGASTMKMMEELMEELISFQERFGPGAKTKERDRRGGNS